MYVAHHLLSDKDSTSSESGSGRVCL